MRKLTIWRSLRNRRHVMLWPHEEGTILPMEKRTCVCGKANDLMFERAFSAYSTEYEPRCLLFSSLEYLDQRIIR